MNRIKKYKHMDDNKDFIKMLKKSLKPQSNSITCIRMMVSGAQKRRAMALSAIKALENIPQKSNVVMFR